jgi:growth factor receptor-bound protein 2
MEAKAIHNFTASERDELDFKKGEILKVINMEDTNWYKAEKRGIVGFVPSNYIEMKPHPWFQGKISRVTAESKLLECSKEGSFLVRESERSPGGFSLSVLANNHIGIHVQHFKVLRDDSGKYFIWVVKFESLNDLINYHKTSSVSRTEDIFLKHENITKVTKQRVKTPISTEPPKKYVTAQYNFVPQEQGELKFKKGDLIIITDDSDENWWRGTFHGDTGLFPASYVK